METVSPVVSVDLPLPLVHRGKVREVFAVGEDRLLIVATDRISAYDVIMDDPIPGKGVILTQLSIFWFNKTRHLVPNHFVSEAVEDFPAELAPYRSVLEGRSILVERTVPILFECVVRGYLAGSAWREYHQSGTVAGIRLPTGMQRGERLPEPLFTPATKARTGHDENITFETLCQRIGSELAEQLRQWSLALYRFGHEYALACGLILADTKFEFGHTQHGELLLIDEVFTPDSSRYWHAESYKPGAQQHEFDKQILRDWLDRQQWNHTYPPPRLTPEVVEQTRQRYYEAFIRLTQCHPQDDRSR